MMLWSLLLGCSVRATLPPEALAELSAPTGCPVYEGAVRASDTAPLLFRYVRHEDLSDDGGRAVHHTSTPGGTPVVLHRASFAGDQGLRGFREVHAQTARVSDVEVVGDRVTFRTTYRGRHRLRTARVREPLVVGPTLFGYLREHPDVQRVGFVVPALRRAVGFRVRRTGEPQHPTFTLRARSPLVRLVVPPMRVVFEEGEVVRYTGRVPPLRSAGRRLRPLDAVVDYSPVACP